MAGLAQLELICLSAVSGVARQMELSLSTSW